MALIVEDNTGKADAESYCSVAEADTWHANRGFTIWSGLSTTEKEQALRRATQFMVQRFRPLWAGYRYFPAQALDWPRAQVPMYDAPGRYGSFPAYYPEPTVPAEVRNACAELAIKAAAGDLEPDVGRLAKREKVGEIEVEYADGAAPVTTHVAVNNMLAPLFKRGGSTMISLVRA